jgi:hypothetical protein
MYDKASLNESTRTRHHALRPERGLNGSNRCSSAIFALPSLSVRRICPHCTDNPTTHRRTTGAAGGAGGGRAHAGGACAGRAGAMTARSLSPSCSSLRHSTAGPPPHPHAHGCCFSTHGQLSAAQGSLRSDIRLIQHLDSSALGLVRRWLLIGYLPIHLLHPWVHTRLSRRNTY